MVECCESIVRSIAVLLHSSSQPQSQSSLQHSALTSLKRRSSVTQLPHHNSQSTNIAPTHLHHDSHDAHSSRQLTIHSSPPQRHPLCFLTLHSSRLLLPQLPPLLFH